MEEFVVKCHCGKVHGRFYCDAKTVIAWECDCSDCSMRRNIHIIVPARNFIVGGNDDDDNNNDDNTILYQWGTQTAQRRFCKTCGILPWYRPRSNPDGYAVTIHCVDWTKGGTLASPPEIQIHKFDGIHWEETMQAMKEKRLDVDISNQSS